MKDVEKLKEKSRMAAVRIPKKLRDAAQKKAEQEDLTFSQLMRRALRKEVNGFIF